MNDSAALKSILLLAANPKGTVSLRLQEEEREIKERLRLVGYGKVPINSTGATRTRDIQQAMLDFKPQIVHFTGHGTGKDGLAFEDGTGQLKLVNSDALASLFKLFSSRVECVVLNACYSEFQAKAIAQHIDYVIGMNQAIGDRAAIEFAVGFYTALGAGESIEFAYELGRNAIQLEGIPEHLTPVLFVKNKDESISLNLGELQAQSPVLLPERKTSPPENDAQLYNTPFEGEMARHSLEPTSVNWHTWLPVLIRRIAVLIPTTRTSFWRRWVLSTTLGVALGAFASFLGGILVGLAQWLVLRKLITRPNRWVFATGVGWALGRILAALIFSNATDYSMGSILAVIFGTPFTFALLGLAQWFFLKERFADARWWIFATTVGGTIGVALSVAIFSAILVIAPNISSESDRITLTIILGIIGFTVGVTIFGATTGIAMVWLLKQSRSKVHVDSQKAPPS
ncbi:CHAT domain-containing protein [Phormidesmis priestleyi ULC007]|uniref:CHAT domain-containing protein n=1 Tax=Phormidesmis priestleyi ULC007 TaxID=1920490 RepID=A0A2T1DNZ2_9CYAN|nr:CHAT domain-containing protein [Phormidesmis priestleyi]PSB22199.1 CHAT domain-containing protein [Phormidesmis priestleyi ULC007]PZO52540.1 MAG: CHAT domain-containing protein [Phormidesmis priestleyi]